MSATEIGETEIKTAGTSEKSSGKSTVASRQAAAVPKETKSVLASTSGDIGPLYQARHNYPNA